MSVSAFQSPPPPPLQPSPSLGKYLRRVYNSRKEILEFNLNTKLLCVWHWPVDPTTAERMSPKVLHDRASAVGSTPRCLCPLKEVDTPFSIGPQASIMKAASGLHSGEYIIKCRSEKCGYLIPLDRIYKEGSYKRSFPPRDSYRRTGQGSTLTIGQSNLIGRKRPLKRTYASLNVSQGHPGPEAHPMQALMQAPTQQAPTQAPALRAPNHLPRFTIPRLEPPVQHPTTDTDFLMRLGSWTQPGLYEEEFRELMERMAQCPCGMIMARDVFNEHRCELSTLKPIKRARLE